MQPEHLVLCGELQGTGSSGTRGHRLSLTEPGRNIALRITDIGRALVTNLPDALIDLLELASYIYCADALVPRGGTTMAHMGRHWRRKFRVLIPVRQPGVWSSPTVLQLLSEALSFLSDDFYQFEFEQIRDPPEFQSYLDLSRGEPHGFRPDEIVLFSGGLDSLAGVIEELIEYKRCIALVSHRSAPKIASRQT